MNGLVKLDQNENPYAPGPSITKVVMDALTQGNRYPRNIADLVGALAKVHGVSPENVLLGATTGVPSLR